jgi:hypothetical protein
LHIDSLEQQVPFRNDRKKGKGKNRKKGKGHDWVRFVCPTLSKIRKGWGTRCCGGLNGRSRSFAALRMTIFFSE